MELVYFIAGIILLVVITFDLFWTTLWVDGGSGPVSSRITTVLWKVMRKISGDKDRILSLAGPLILTVILFTWVLSLWAGWTLLFAGDNSSLIDTRDDGPISWTERIYFVAYTMFTMGNGDFSPRDGFWQIATSLTTASGMLFVTLAVSYVIAVLGSVTQKRSFADSVTGLGKRGIDLVEIGWDGRDLSNLNLLIVNFASNISTITQQHKAYPILHYYHSGSSRQASGVAVAILDEALTLMKFGVPEENQPNPANLKEARSSIESYLETLNSAFIKPADQLPPSPDLKAIQQLKVPTVSEEEFQKHMSTIEERRKKLLGMIEADAWKWPL